MHMYGGILEIMHLYMKGHLFGSIQVDEECGYYHTFDWWF
jgi:hypothetical protein